MTTQARRQMTYEEIEREVLDRKARELRDKKLRSCDYSVLGKLGIAKHRWAEDLPDLIDIKRLNEELLAVRGCGEKVLAAIKQMRNNIRIALLAVDSETVKR
ncbi:MAG: hypothetical protein SPL96_10950 [Bacteroidales bacterium]|nr:hypothetical protein [Bacteroidales bacterium]